MSGAGLTDPTDMGGASPFTVEAMLPTSLMFYEMKTTNSATRPPAVAAGWFCMDPGGLLLFTAGPLPGLPQPLIVGASRSNGVSRISFTCTNCVNYRLRYAADLGSTFNPLFGSIAGDKTNALKVLTDSTSAARRFYVVEPYR